MKKSSFPSIPSWYTDAARLMARNSISLKQAAMELKKDIDPDECERLMRDDRFKAILRAEKNKYHREIADDPGRTKSAVLGMMTVALENLATEGEWDKVLAGAEKIAKMEGWLGAESNINIFSGLTAKDIAAEKQKILEEIESGSTKEVLPN